MIYDIKNTIVFKIRDPSWTPKKIEQFLTYTLVISKGDIAKDGENSQKVVKSMRILCIYIYIILLYVFFQEIQVGENFAHYTQ